MAVMDWQLQLNLLLRVLLAAGLSAVVGLEREAHGRPAGLRTHVLVGAGGALVMATVEALIPYFTAAGLWEAGVRLDAGRLAAGVITGIGFLGAGTILRVGDWVRGLTTAASLWFAAGIGIVAGDGFFALAVGATVLGWIVLTVLDYFEDWIPSTVYHDLIIEVSPEHGHGVVGVVMQLRKSYRMRVELNGWKLNEPKDRLTLDFLLRHKGSVDISEVATRLSKLDGVLTLAVE